MKKLSILLVIICGLLPPLHASKGRDQRLSSDEFRAKQQAYITEKANLTKTEASKFFPVYFELQNKKKKLSDDSWKQMRKGRDENTTDAEYSKILECVYDNRIASDELEKTYFERFKKILSPKKLYQIQRAEIHFHRELLKDSRKRQESGSSRNK